jgi:hypothetical protein
LEPIYIEAADKLKAFDPPIRIAKVDCTKEAMLCLTQFVMAYPTLRIFKSRLETSFEGERSVESIIFNMKK